jgi:hypothetical protein
MLNSALYASRIRKLIPAEHAETKCVSCIADRAREKTGGFSCEMPQRPTMLIWHNETIQKRSVKTYLLIRKPIVLGNMNSRMTRIARAHLPCRTHLPKVDPRRSSISRELGKLAGLAFCFLLFLPSNAFLVRRTNGRGHRWDVAAFDAMFLRLTTWSRTPTC